jgi:AraC family transcriptional regulator of adaptative response/methylated-DNA-[protein]-cysteine methyltransferase
MEKKVHGNCILPKSFIVIDAMTKEETANNGENLEISYGFTLCPFGKIMIASTAVGICSVTLVSKDETTAIENLNKMFPKSMIKFDEKLSKSGISKAFGNADSSLERIRLHLKGTDFQLKVWNALLEIPFGETVSYGYIASKIGHPKACRAVGSAVGDNPIFYLIPCHRVIQSSGKIGNYFWGTAMKTTILERENPGYFNKSDKLSGK